VRRPACLLTVARRRPRVVQVTKKGDPLEPLFLTLLLEDRSPAGMSYVEYLVHVHREISNKQR